MNLMKDIWGQKSGDRREKSKKTKAGLINIDKRLRLQLFLPTSVLYN